MGRAGLETGFTLNPLRDAAALRPRAEGFESDFAKTVGSKVRFIASLRKGVPL